MTDGVLPVECTVARTNCIHRAIVFEGNEYHRVCIGWSIAAYQGSVMRSKEDEKAGDQRTDYENGGDALTRRIKRFGDVADTGIKGVDCIVVGKAMGAALPLPVCCCSSPGCSGKMYCSEAGSPVRGVTGGNARMRASISRYSACTDAQAGHEWICLSRAARSVDERSPRSPAAGLLGYCAHGALGAGTVLLCFIILLLSRGGPRCGSAPVQDW